MSLALPEIYRKKEVYSQARLTELTNRVQNIEAAKRIPGLTIFVAGSYARLEASENSDIDPFFICEGIRDDEPNPRTNELEMFGELIATGKQMGFPKFSGDCRYLEVHAAEKVKEYLGGRDDDARNYFTLRLLMLLESKPLFGEQNYETVLNQFIDSYFRDYPDHQATFEPTFLVNDIARYWRTLLANYEHLRNQQGSDHEKLKQKIRNYKLKYSRLTTCFATIAALAAYDTPVSPEVVLEVIRQTPRQRLESLTAQRPQVAGSVQVILDLYAEFLKLTELTTDDLEVQFNDKGRLRQLFEQAGAYGDQFFGLLKELDDLQGIAGRKILRTLVV